MLQLYFLYYCDVYLSDMTQTRKNEFLILNFDFIMTNYRLHNS